mmetsp:Transcript_10461/g.17045  ORF Transcript_10461/g.17045 Transcript_10461/m.17045 type:complete len:264 (+) Transcript_10461:464-1255(+)|eukprot:CAMPEP_0203756718 /NCGR_PEP_ID=MMETSP0098-20131031/9936_1 /ASSEMBLY_ACC=CAM_ASM_000208 /TAXON_ID=96639 /ORGANISM=" , Strain NY0313808BC1" /LENGTH=263 /DNA_ID=CAMNT_0050648693 /DNA_START=342 /DNA_END=1133 /DNA_ORIENTATION=+
MEQFRENGFYVCDGLLRNELPELLNLAQELTAVTEDTTEQKIDYVVPKPGFDFDENTHKLRKVQGVCCLDQNVRDRLFKHPKIVEQVVKLLPKGSSLDQLDFFGTKFFPKFPGGGESVDWHQDSYFFGSGNSANIISAAIYLEDTDKENGCLRVVPTSHRSGVEYPMEPARGKWQGHNWIDLDKLLDNNKEYRDQDVKVQAGTVVFFDARIVHGAYPNKSLNRSRKSFFGHYCPGDLSFSWRGTDFSRGKYEDRHSVSVLGKI